MCNLYIFRPEIDPRFLFCLASHRFLGRFAAVDVSLHKAIVAVFIPRIGTAEHQDLPGAFDYEINCQANFKPLFRHSMHVRYFIASMPEVISETSRVIAAWRTLLNVRVSPFAISFALSVAFFIATMRAECSDALFSSNA